MFQPETNDSLFEPAAAYLRQSWARRQRGQAGNILCYLIYWLFHVVASPILAIHGLRRSRKRGHRAILWTRLFGGSKPPNGPVNVLIYAGGLGEKRAGFAFAEVLKRERGLDVPVLVQVANAAKISHESVHSGIMPYNNPVSVLLFLARWRPKAILGVEFWDNHHLSAACLFFRIRTVIFNCPITEQSIRGMSVRKRWRYQFIGAYCCQSAENVSRLTKKVQIPDSRVIETGPVCLAVDPVQGMSIPKEEMKQQISKRLGLTNTHFPVIVAGSTYKEEELVLIEAFELVRSEFPSAVLILAPRGVNRPGGCDSALKQLDKEFCTYSSAKGEIPPSGVVLVDTVGDLKYLYSVGTVAFVGGSMGQHGAGHTPVEAMAWGLPISIGPVHPQQRVIVDLLLKEQLCAVCSASDELAEFWLRVAKDDGYRENVQGRIASLLSNSDEMILRIYDQLINC